MAALLGFAFVVVFAMSVGDLLAFHVLSMVFGYSYDTASMVFWSTTAYFLAALWLAGTSDNADHYPLKWLAWMHKAASRWLWRVFWLVLLGGMLAGWTDGLTATESEHFVEPVGSWWAQGLQWRDGGSDSYTFPVAERSPILRDLETGELFQAQDKDSEEALGYALVRNNGIEFGRTDATRNVYDGLTIGQARVTLRRTIYGKTLILRVRYEDIDTLKDPVRHSALCRAVASGQHSYLLWRRMMRDQRLWNEMQQCPKASHDNPFA